MLREHDPARFLMMMGADQSDVETMVDKRRLPASRRFKNTPSVNPIMEEPHACPNDHIVYGFPLKDLEALEEGVDQAWGDEELGGKTENEYISIAPQPRRQSSWFRWSSRRSLSPGGAKLPPMRPEYQKLQAAAQFYYKCGMTVAALMSLTGLVLTLIYAGQYTASQQIRFAKGFAEAAVMSAILISPILILLGAAAFAIYTCQGRFVQKLLDSLGKDTTSKEDSVEGIEEEMDTRASIAVRAKALIEKHSQKHAVKQFENQIECLVF